MQTNHFLPHSLQDDLLIFTSSHLKQIFINSKVKDMFIQNSLIKAAPSKASLCKCAVRRDIITLSPMGRVSKQFADRFAIYRCLIWWCHW